MKKSTKLIMFMIAIMFLLVVSACSKREEINPEFQIVSLYRTNDNFLKNNHDYFIIRTYDDYLEMNISNIKNHEEEYFEDNMLIIFNIAKSQSIEFVNVSFKATKKTLYVDIELSNTLEMTFDGFSVLVEMPKSDIKKVSIREKIYVMRLL